MAFIRRVRTASGATAAQIAEYVAATIVFTAGKQSVLDAGNYGLPR